MYNINYIYIIILYIILIILYINNNYYLFAIN